MNKWIILEIVIAVLLHIYCNSKIHGEHNYIIVHLNLAVIPYSVIVLILQVKKLNLSIVI